ncbi:12744_t:CDS:2, partial [Funneliformis geosporum]
SKITELILGTLVLRQQGLLNYNESLEGTLKIEGFNNLKTFSSFPSNFTKLEFNNCPNLTKIFCSDGKLTDLNITNCPQLTILQCGINQLTSLNVNGLSNLQEINCVNNKLTSLDFLDQLPSPKKLTRLFLENNNFPTQNLEIFRQFSNLTHLALYKNRFYGSLEPLKDLTKLEVLTIDNTDIDSGLEYLPDSLEKIGAPENNQELVSKVKKESPEKQIEIKLESSSSSKKKSKRTKQKEKLNNAQEQIAQLQNELEIEKNKNNKLQKELEELKNKHANQNQITRKYLQNQKAEVEKAENQLDNLELQEEQRREIRKEEKVITLPAVDLVSYAENIEKRQICGVLTYQSHSLDSTEIIEKKVLDYLKEKIDKYNPENYAFLVNKYVGGKIEPGETPLEAAKREVFEETNLIIEDLEIVSEQAFDKKNQHCMGYLVKANKYSGEIKIKEVEKIADIKFKRIDYEFAVNRLFYAIIFEVD